MHKRTVNTYSYWSSVVVLPSSGANSQFSIDLSISTVRILRATFDVMITDQVTFAPIFKYQNDFMATTLLIGLTAPLPVTSAFQNIIPATGVTGQNVTLHTPGQYTFDGLYFSTILQSRVDFYNADPVNSFRARFSVLYDIEVIN